MITLTNISKVFPDGTLALKTINLMIPKGQFVVVLGPSGSGKTTIIKSINGTIKPDSGSIAFFDDKEILSDNKKLRDQLGVVFQEFNLVENLSGINNVLTGLLSSSSKLWSLFYIFSKTQRLMALDCLNRVGLLHKAYSRVSTLSGGQKQRIGIARAIIKRPTILLADEPVASLDPLIARDVLTLIRDLSKDMGITVLCSLHQVDLALEFSDRIVGLRDGEIIIDAKTEDVSNHDIRAIYEGSARGMIFGVKKENA